MRVSAVLMVLLVVGSDPGAAQLVRVDDDTRIRQVSFEVAGDAKVTETDLAARVSTRGRRQLLDLRRSLGWIPFMPEIEDPRLDPFELQRDKERLRRFLEQVGYPETVVDYDVSPRSDNRVDVHFRIEPGTPLLVASQSLEWTDSSSAPGLTAGDILDDADLRLRIGRPLDRRALEPSAAAVRRYLADRGHPNARVDARVDVGADPAEGAAVVYHVESGPRSRIGTITIHGTERLSVEDIEGLLIVHPGDLFSASRLERAGRRIESLDIVRSANFDLAPGMENDTIVDLSLLIRELPRRVIGAQVGYTTDGGIAGDARWTNRNAFGGGRSLTFTLAGQTGVVAIEQDPERFVRGAAAVRQPLFGPLLITLSTGPFAEYRNDYRDRSIEGGVSATLVRPVGALSSVSLNYELSVRRIFEYRFGDISAGINFFELLQQTADGVLDELGETLDRSVLTLSASLLRLDSPTDPRRGIALQPAISATVSGFNATQFVRTNVRASAYLPLTESFRLATRGGWGRVFPFGRSVPEAQEEGLKEFLRLRDEVLTAGGMDDSRGWANRMLGPKFPDVDVIPGDSTDVYEVNGYVPIGGLQRAYGTVELRFPAPLPGGEWSAHTFLDAGRVWTSDERFTDPNDPYGVEKIFFSTGIGLDYQTPVGALRVTLGYKLNPSKLDLADADDALRALLDTGSLEGVPLHQSRRLRLHIGFGGAL